MMQLLADILKESGKTLLLLLVALACIAIALLNDDMYSLATFAFMFVMLVHVLLSRVESGLKFGKYEWVSLGVGIVCVAGYAAAYVLPTVGWLPHPIPPDLEAWIPDEAKTASLMALVFSLVVLVDSSYQISKNEIRIDNAEREISQLNKRIDEITNSQRDGRAQPK